MLHLGNSGEVQFGVCPSGLSGDPFKTHVNLHLNGTRIDR